MIKLFLIQPKFDKAKNEITKQDKADPTNSDIPFCQKKQAISSKFNKLIPHCGWINNDTIRHGMYYNTVYIRHTTQKNKWQIQGGTRMGFFLGGRIALVENQNLSSKLASFSGTIGSGVQKNTPQFSEPPSNLQLMYLFWENSHTLRLLSPPPRIWTCGSATDKKSCPATAKRKLIHQNHHSDKKISSIPAVKHRKISLQNIDRELYTQTWNNPYVGMMGGQRVGYDPSNSAVRDKDINVINNDKLFYKIFFKIP